MACVPVSLRSGLWKLASFLALLLLTLGPASAAPARSVLALPVTTPWVLEPTAAAVTKAWPEALARAGARASLALPDSPYVTMAQREGWMTPAELASGRLEDFRYALAVVARTDLVLTARLSVEGPRAVLEATLEDILVQQPVTLRVTAARDAAPEAVGEALARALAAQLTPPVWESLKAEADRRGQSAAARYAAGQAAAQAGRWPEAALQFELASLGDPTRADYLLAGARALDACGRPEQAYARALRAAQLHPGTEEYTRAVGEYALQARRFEAAETAFEVLSAFPGEAAALEGLARVRRARGDAEGSRARYLQLLAALPTLREEPPSLAGLLARQRDDSVRFSGASADQVDLQLVRLYFSGAEYAQGVRVLYRYHQGNERPAYGDADYVAFAQGLDEEAVRLAREVEEHLRAFDVASEPDFEAYHDRSERLADVGEGMRVSPRLEAAHRFRVLAYNALNESDYEALQFVRTQGASHRRRAALLREASRMALQEADTRQKEALAPSPEAEASP